MSLLTSSNAKCVLETLCIGATKEDLNIDAARAFMTSEMYTSLRWGLGNHAHAFTSELTAVAGKCMVRYGQTLAADDQMCGH